MQYITYYFFDNKYLNNKYVHILRKHQYIIKYRNHPQYCFLPNKIDRIYIYIIIIIINQ
jgi:hypothetical protein